MIAILLTAAAPSVRAETRVSIDFFYDNLDPYGTWREVGEYGYCWQPRDVDRDWQPYSDGRWVYTDAGWTWDSEEPYAWAVYHYGRWAFVEDTGWIWVPDTQWGPGWVSWRHSNNYVGWAPLPPEARFVANVGFSSWVDNYYDIGPSHYRFVETRNFGDRRLRSRFVDSRQNLTIINSTTNITNITYADSVVHNGGPRYEEIAAISVQPIQRFRLDRQQQFEGNSGSERGERFRSREDGGSLRVFAPPIELSATAVPKRVAERVDRVAINHGWKNVGTEAEVGQLRTQMKSKAQPPPELPPQPKFEKPVVQQATDPSTKQTQKPFSDAPPSSVVKPGATDTTPSIRPNVPDRADQPPATPIPRKPGNGGPAVRPQPPERHPVVPGTEPELPRIKPTVPADNTNRPEKPSNTKGDRPRQPGPTEPIPTVKTPAVTPKPDVPPVIPHPATEAPRVRPLDTTTTRTPDKKPDLPKVRERDGKPQRPEETPLPRKPDPTPIPSEKPPTRRPQPATPEPEIKRPAPPSQSDRVPPPRNERPSNPPVPTPQRKPEIIPQQPVTKPPTGESEQPVQGKGKGKPKDKNKDDPDKN